MDQQVTCLFARVLSEFRLHVETYSGNPNHLLHGMYTACGDKLHINWFHLEYGIEVSAKALQTWYGQIERPKICSWSTALLTTNGANTIKTVYVNCIDGMFDKNRVNCINGSDIVNHVVCVNRVNYIDGTNVVNHVDCVNCVCYVCCSQSTPLMRFWSHHRIVRDLVADAALRAKLFMLIRHRARAEGGSVKNLPLDICKEILWHANQRDDGAL
jgi:hypothetical protein